MATTGAIDAPREQGLAAVHRYFEVSLFLLISTGVATLVFTGKLDPASTLLPPLALAVKAFRYLRGKGPELSHRAATWLTIGYLAFFPLDLFGISRALAAGSPNPLLFAALLSAIHLMLFALIVRLYSARTTRDHMFLTMLAFALMLTAAILTVDTLYLGFFLLFLVLAVSTFVGLEMRRSAEGSVVPPLATGTPAAGRLQKALRTTSTVVAVGSLALGTLVFLVIPRVTAGYLSGLNLQPQLISGFSEDSELGQIGTIKKSAQVVMRVRVEGGRAPVNQLRWRGLAQSNFDGRRWASEREPDETVLPGSQGWYYLRPSKPEVSFEEIRAALNSNQDARRLYSRSFVPLFYTVLLEPIASDTLFFATFPSAVRGRFAPEIQREGRRPRSYLLIDTTRSVSNPYHTYQRLLYEASSLVPEVPPQALRSHQIGYSEEIKERYLQLPEIDPRIRELAQQVTANEPTAYDKAAAIERHLKTRYGYTLDLTAGNDPLAHFLFERRAGHCEYFATAMTVMLRTLDIPARYVKGFLPGEYNDVGEDYIVRGSDAHTWVEVYFGEYGWIPFDPTPGSDDPPTGWLGRLMHYYDWFELMWSDWIINYDLARQMNLGQNLRRASIQWTEDATKYFREKRRATLDTIKGLHYALMDSRWALPGALAVLVLALAVLRGRRVREWLARYVGGAGGSHELTPKLATLYYEQLLRALGRRGFKKARGQTALEFATSLPVPELATPVGELTALYQDARFGARKAEAGQMSRTLESVKSVLRSLPKS